MGLEQGRYATATLIVEDVDTAIAMRSGDVAVLATPRVLSLVEEAAVAAIRDALPPERTSVGAWVELEHLAPTRVGGTVEAAVTLVNVDGAQLTFEATVTEDGAEVARAHHRRVVVSRARFA